MSKDDKYAPRPWKCEHCGMTLGLVLRDADRVRRLSIFRAAKTDAQIRALLAFPDGGLAMFSEAEFAAIDIDSGKILCQFCGAKRCWDVSSEALDEMQLRRQARTFGLSSQ